MCSLLNAGFVIILPQDLWVSSIRRGPRTQLMSGLRSSYRTQPSRCICQAFGLSTWSRGSLTPFRTLCLHRVVWGIKRSHGSSSSMHLPITDNIMMVIWQSLKMACADHCMFWTACTVGYFGFLCSAKFTVPSMASFSTSLHLSARDIAVDGILAPSCRRVRIKASKTDSLRNGAQIHIGWGVYPLYAVQTMMAYLMQRANVPGPLFLLQYGHPLSCVRLMDWNFSSHSSLIGAATMAARNGVPDHLIQASARWSSNAYQLYIHTPSETLASLSHKLA